MKQKIAERIRMARLAKNLSQQNVADELGLTVAAYSNIERGITDITVSRLTQISEILKKDISEFLGLQTEGPVNEPPLIYQNTLAQQLLLLSQQVSAIQVQLGKLETDFRKLEEKSN